MSGSGVCVVFEVGRSWSRVSQKNVDSPPPIGVFWTWRYIYPPKEELEGSAGTGGRLVVFFYGMAGCRKRGTKQKQVTAHILYDMIYHFSLSKITAFRSVSGCSDIPLHERQRGKGDKDRQIEIAG